MILSEDRQSHLAHVAIDGIWNDDLVDYKDDDQALREAKKIITEFVQATEKIDDGVRTKISAQKKGIFEGSREWDILYKKYYEEEARKHGW